MMLASMGLLWLVVIALLIGSFLGVLIVRLPQGRSVLAGRSCCDNCGAVLAPWQMVPLFSYIVQRGRCPRCQERIDPVHIWIELAALSVALLVAWRAVSVPQLVGWCGLGWLLLTLMWLDLRHLWLPDILTLPGILAGLGFCAWVAPDDLTAHAIGTVAGFLALAAVRSVYRWLRKRDGLGLGDAKLLALAGAWCGWQALPMIMLAAALYGIVVTLLLRRSGKLPLGAFMCPFIFLAALGLLPSF